MDPNGWITNPPQTILKIRDVASRASLNGQYGVALTYQEDRGRYIVHLVVSQEQVSLRAGNLIKCSWYEQLQAQYLLLRHDPNVRRQVQDVYRQVSDRTGGRISVEKLGLGCLALFIGMLFVLGVSKTFLLLSFLMTVGIVLGPDVAAGKSPREIMNNSPERVRDVFNRHVPYVGPTIASNKYMMAAVVALYVAYVGRGLLAPATTTTAAAAATSRGGGWFGSGGGGGPAVPHEIREKYYKLGFEDATEGRLYKTSLPPPDTEDAPISYAGDDDVEIDDLDADNNIVAGDAKKRASPWSISTLMSVAYSGKTIYELGLQPGAGWSLDAARQNVITLEPWKTAFLAFSLYRIVTAFL